MTREGFPCGAPTGELKETNFISQPSFRERRYERIWATYLQYAPGDMRPERFGAAEILRREFCRYLVASHDGAAAKDGKDDEKIVSLDLYLIRVAMPPATRDDRTLAALWATAGDERQAALVESTIVPARQGFNPYRRGLLIASYYPQRDETKRFESGTFVTRPDPAAARDTTLKTRKRPPRRMQRTDWFPSGTRYASGPYHLDWEAVEGQWTEWAPGGIAWQGPYVRGEQSGASVKDGVWYVSYPDGTLKAQGKFERGLRQGIWHEFYSDGGLFEEVMYVNGQQHGQSSRWYRGRVPMEQGEFRNGQREGKWTYWDPLGFHAQQGPFENGLRHGQWTAWHRNGKLARREHYERGVLNGWLLEFFPADQTVSKQGEMRGGVPHGPWQAFFPSGQLAEEGENLGGRPHGVQRTYYRATASAADDEPPRLHKEATYAEGKLQGPFTEYYQSGAVLERGEYVAQQQQGVWTVWYPDGKEREQGAFRDGREQGPWTYWYENGQKSREGSYEAGLQEGEWKSYWEDGTPMTVGKFVEGCAARAVVQLVPQWQAQTARRVR